MRYKRRGWSFILSLTKLWRRIQLTRLLKNYDQSCGIFKSYGIFKVFKAGSVLRSMLKRDAYIFHYDRLFISWDWHKNTFSSNQVFLERCIMHFLWSKIINFINSIKSSNLSSPLPKHCMQPDTLCSTLELLNENNCWLHKNI